MVNSGIPLCAGEYLDMGSFQLVKSINGVYELQGLSIDVDKLPKVQAIGTGSTAYCIDNGTLYMYEKTTRTWYEQ